MTTLSIWRFETPDAAEIALRTLERLQLQRLLVVDDAAVVAWSPGERHPRAYQAGSAAGTAELSGAFWGLLFGVLFLLPLAGPEAAPPGGTVTTPAADPATGLSHIGLSDELLQQIREHITANTSALFLLTHDTVVDRIGETLVDTHPDLLATTLGRTQEAALRRAFQADPTAAP